MDYEVELAIIIGKPGTKIKVLLYNNTSSHHIFHFFSFLHYNLFHLHLILYSAFNSQSIPPFLSLAFLQLPSFLSPFITFFVCVLFILLISWTSSVFLSYQEEDAMNHVAGYTVAHDVSARDWQLKRNGGQWLIGKTFDSFCPLGPAIVTKDSISGV